MSSSEKALQAGGGSVFNGQIPEYSSNEGNVLVPTVQNKLQFRIHDICISTAGFPLMQMLSRPPFLPKFVGSPTSTWTIIKR
jgi:hypothetical protein